jgi:hypothetical protein
MSNCSDFSALIGCVDLSRALSSQAIHSRLPYSTLPEDYFTAQSVHPTDKLPIISLNILLHVRVKAIYLHAFPPDVENFLDALHLSEIAKNTLKEKLVIHSPFPVCSFLRNYSNLFKK